MSSIVLSKEKRRQYHQNKSSMSPIVYLERKEDHNTKTKQKFYVTLFYLKKKDNNNTKTKVLCHPLFYLKKKDNNNTKTKQKFYVTHCVI